MDYFELESVEELIHQIKGYPIFFNNYLDNITVHLTQMFRDPFVWKFLKENIVSDFENLSEFNVWLAGCSTGEESKSMAIVLDESGLLHKSNIYATDLNLL
ncbi:MAG: chemotaxis protein CheR, partial [Flavobacteriales bacterium]